MTRLPTTLTHSLHEFTVSIGRVLGVAAVVFLQLTCDMLACHVVLFGGTRQGKTKLLEYVISQIILKSSAGLCYIDPHSDGADDLFARLCYFFDGLGFRKLNLHILRPRTRLFSIDLFAYEAPKEDPYGDPEFTYRVWLANRCETVTRLILRGHTDTEEERQKQNRLARWLYNALYTCGVRQDARGTHEPLSNLSALLNPLHPRHDDVYLRVRPHLDHPQAEEVFVDFEKQLRLCKTPSQVNDLTESSLNAFRRFFRGVVPQILDNPGGTPTINFRRLIETNAIVLCSFGMDEDALSRQQSITLGGIFTYLFYEAARVIPKEDRQPFHLVIDEAHNLLDEDFEVILTEAAKFKLYFLLAVQHLSKLEKGQLDLLPAVLSQCGVRITFQQQFQEHAETLAKCLCYRQLDFEPLVHEVDRQGSIIWNIVPSVSYGRTNGDTVNIGHTESSSHTDSAQRTVTESESETDSVTESHTETSGTGESLTHGASIGKSHGRTDGGSREFGWSKSEGVTNTATRSSTDANGTQQTNSLSSASHSGSTFDSATGQLSNLSRSLGQTLGSSDGNTRMNATTDAKGHAETESESESHSFGRNWNVSQQDSLSRSLSLSTSQNQSESDGRSIGKSTQKGTSTANGTGSANQTGAADSVQVGKSSGTSQGESFTYSPMRDVRTEEQLTGQLKMSVNDQVARFTAGIMSLPKQCCLISISSWQHAVPIRVDDVFDPYEENGYSAAYRAFDVTRVMEFVFETQPYYFRLSDRRAVTTPRPTAPGSTSRSDQFFPEDL